MPLSCLCFFLIAGKVRDYQNRWNFGGEIDDMKELNAFTDGIAASLFHNSRLQNWQRRKGENPSRRRFVGAEPLHGDPLEHPGGDGEARGEGSREVLGLHPRLAVVEVLRVAVGVVGLPVRRRRRGHAAGGAEQDPLLLPLDAAPQAPQPRAGS